MIYKPSFKTDFLPFQWSKYNGRNNAHPEQKEEDTGVKLTETANVVLRLSTRFWNRFEEGTVLGLVHTGHFHSSSLARKCVLAFYVDIPMQLECTEQHWDPQSSKVTFAHIIRGRSDHFQEAPIFTYPDNSVQPIVGTCNIWWMD